MPSTSATRIVFDLDGTLVQTRVASWEVFREVQQEFGLGIDTEQKYFALLEDNLFVSLRRLCRDEAQADALTARFLERLETDYFPELIPGIADVVHALADRATLAVISSNATSVIRRVLEANGLQYCFSHVFGGDIEPDKSAGLTRFLTDAAQGAGRRCAAAYDEVSGPESASHSDTVLVTDTTGDIEAAATAGVRAVGVSWGMHSPQDLTAAGAEFVAVWPQELIAHLRPETAPEGAGGCVVPALGIERRSIMTTERPRQRSERSEPRVVAVTVPTETRAQAAAAEIRRARRSVPPSHIQDRRNMPQLSSAGCGCAPLARATPEVGRARGSVAEIDAQTLRRSSWSGTIDAELLAAMRDTLG